MSLFKDLKALDPQSIAEELRQIEIEVEIKSIEAEYNDDEE